MKSSKGKKINQDSTSSKLRAAGLAGGVERRKGEWELARDQRSGRDKTGKRESGHGKLDLPHNAIVAMAYDKASGMGNDMIAKKYHVSDGYVADALKRLFIDHKIGRVILKGVLLENAVASGMHARKQLSSMNGMQAAVATGIFTDRFVQLDKHMASQPVEVDFNELQQVGGILKQLQDSVGGITSREIPAIDIEAEIVEGGKK